jgi:hypothetical protein
MTLTIKEVIKMKTLKKFGDFSFMTDLWGNVLLASFVLFLILLISIYLWQIVV